MNLVRPPPVFFYAGGYADADADADISGVCAVVTGLAGRLCTGAVVVRRAGAVVVRRTIAVLVRRAGAVLMQCWELMRC